MNRKITSFTWSNLERLHTGESKLGSEENVGIRCSAGWGEGLLGRGNQAHKSLQVEWGVCAD